MHNILEQHWGVPLPSPITRRVSEIKRNCNSDTGLPCGPCGIAILSAVSYIKGSDYSIQFQSGRVRSSLLLEDVAQCWGTRLGVNLHKPKLNSSHFQVSRAGIF
jgi:hypothetical protein